MTLRVRREIWELVSLHLSGRIVRSSGWADWCAETAHRDDALIWC